METKQSPSTLGGLSMEKANIVPCMNDGDKEISYANNSLLQKSVLIRTKPILEDTIRGLFNSIDVPTCIRMADLGCGSGLNTFLTVSQVVDIVDSIRCRKQNPKTPEFQVFLNDLPFNDFSSVFRSVPGFCSKLISEDKGHCFFIGVPDSFYGRLFPEKTMHFIHSSNSVHWLSKIPEKLENNKGNIYMAKSSPPEVIKAYSEQFQMDFSNFLRLRSAEMISGGRMLLTLIGRTLADPRSKDCCYIFELLAKSLFDLVAEGLIEESDVNSFNLPYYNPCREEIRDIIAKEGSFYLDTIEMFETNWDYEDDISNKSFVFNKYKSAKNFANTLRAVSERMLSSHFGEIVIDKLFTKFGDYVAEHLEMEKTKHVFIVTSLTRKLHY